MTSKALDILYVLDRYPERSQTFVIDEINTMLSRGHRVEVLHLEGPFDEYTEAAPAGRHVPVPAARGGSGVTTLRRRLLKVTRLLRLLMSSFVRRPTGTARAIVHTLEPAKPRRFAVLLMALEVVAVVGRRPVRRVHAHFAWYSASVALAAAKLLSVPFSVTVHGNDLYALRFDLERKLRQADATITTCDYFRRELELLEPTANIHVVPLPVNAARFQRQKAWRKDPFSLVAVGRLVEKKGYADLVEALGILRNRGLDIPCVIGGDGPERARLGERVRQLDLADTVTFRGSLSHEEVRELLEDATVFVAPFVVASDGDRDAMPVALKEAMAMELPVVSTIEVGIPELVDATVGRLVAPGDPVALADALGELREMPPAQLAAMGRAGRERILEGYVPEVTHARLVELLGLR